MSRPKLVAGNWKMHGSLAGNLSLLTAVRAGAAGLKNQMAVCVPAPYLAQAQSVLAGSDVAWGAQDVSRYAQGAYTGEVGAAMLKDFGCRYAIVGHSERRTYHGETDEAVAAKAESAIRCGLVPIICVGETLAEREANATGEVVTRQMDAVIARIGASGLAKSVVAYEPVWAIGTGKTATPQQAQEVHALIRARAAQADPAVAGGLLILYGGSMKPNNARDLMGQPDIDGGLIGGAALVADDFLAICAA
ncbi:MAG: triose-phosphate isomerase [Candidatus Nitricoxidivorans perseverans]|uniref:Triosephosphate isomerase n=1 Tax=Candidatus Nitricoxidivorans perseverans TaxID=2975601 RepID=A0AA49FLD0_9PROT|nr:MAG: triose-phosphate isomerase [Candidatus Nitricoxidivorans perseverans]